MGCVYNMPYEGPFSANQNDRKLGVFYKNIIFILVLFFCRGQGGTALKYYFHSDEY